MLTHSQYIWDWEEIERERHHLKSRCWVTSPLATPSSGLDKTFFIEEFAPRLFSEVRRHMSRLDQWVDLTANCSRLSRNYEELKLVESCGSGAEDTLASPVQPTLTQFAVQTSSLLRRLAWVTSHLHTWGAGETRKAYPTKVRHELKKWRIVLLYIRPSASWPA